MIRALDVLAPPRLGTGFRWLLSSSWSSNLSDGIQIAAGPLLVAMSALVQWLPALLFGLQAGAITDRLDRRRLTMAVNLVRAVVLAVIATTVATGAASIGVILAALFVLATAEVFADNASQTLLPMLVDRDDLVVANARLQGGFVTLNQLVGPPVGAALFAIGMAWPFAAQALLVAASAVLVGRIALPAVPRDRKPRTAIRHEIAEGFRWVRHHPAVRVLVLTIFIFNITFGAAWSVLVLYVAERLGLGAIGFGVVTTVMALGGLLGTVGYGWITRRLSLGNIMRIGLILETLTHLALAVTTSPAVALPIFFAFGVHAFVWSTTSVTIRQRAAPLDLQGRVTSVNMVGVYGGLVLGAAVGGLLAREFGVTAPFWFAFAGSAVFLVLIWRQLANIAHDHPSDVDPNPGPSAPSTA